MYYLTSCIIDIMDHFVKNYLNKWYCFWSMKTPFKKDANNLFFKEWTITEDEMVEQLVFRAETHSRTTEFHTAVNGW